MTSIPLNGPNRRRFRRGSTLLLVFWLLAMMGLIIYSTVVIVRADMDMTLAQKQAFRARQLAEMGINIAMNPVVKEFDEALLNQGPGNRNTVPLPLQIPLEEGEMVNVKIKGEGGRININKLLEREAGGNSPKKAFHFLLSAWGVPDPDGETHDTLYDRLVDWVDADSTVTGLHGAEKDEYQAQFGENTSYPFNRPFYDLDELPKVPGFTILSSVRGDWRDFFTIYSGSVGIDPDQADAKVIAAVMMMLKSSEPDPADFAEAIQDAQEIIDMRSGADEIPETEDDVKIQQADALASLGLTGTEQEMTPGGFTAGELIGSADQTVHIEAIATVGEYRKRVVLIVRNRTGTPQILNREELPLTAAELPPTQ